MASKLIADEGWLTRAMIIRWIAGFRQHSRHDWVFCNDQQTAAWVGRQLMEFTPELRNVQYCTPGSPGAHVKKGLAYSPEAVEEIGRRYRALPQIGKGFEGHYDCEGVALILETDVEPIRKALVGKKAVLGRRRDGAIRKFFSVEVLKQAKLPDGSPIWTC